MRRSGANCRRGGKEGREAGRMGGKMETYTAGIVKFVSSRIPCREWDVRFGLLSI